MILTILSIAVIFGTIATIVTFVMTRQVISLLAVKYLDSIVVQQEATIEDMFENSMTLARNVATQKPVIAYMEQEDPMLQDAELIEQFNNIDINRQYQSIYIMDRTGKTLTSTDASFIGQNYGFREYFKKAIMGEAAIDAAIGATTGKFGYFFAYPIRIDGKEPVGVAVVKLKDLTVDTALQPKILSEGGAAMLVDEYGVVIQSNKPELLFKSMGPLSPEVQKAIMETGRFRDRKIGALQYEELQQEIRTLQNSKAFSTYDTAKEQDMAVAMARIKKTPFFIVIEEPVQSFAAAVERSTGIISAVSIVGAILAALIALIVITRLLKPLSRLKDWALKVAKGDFKQTISVKTGDEFEELGSAFNAMVEKLNDVYVNLESKIWERTADFEKFRLAVEAVSDPVIITDLDGRIIYANKASENITGYARNEMIGNRPSLWGRQMPTAFYEQMWNTIKYEKKVFHGEMTNKRKGGDLYAAEVHIAPLLMEKERLYGFVGVERDITKQKEVDRARTEFVSIASHQLRTPLAVINWYLEMVLQEDIGSLNKEQRKYLGQVQAASHRMVNLVNALLNVSRMDLGIFSVTPEPIKLENIANEVLTELQQQIDEKGITITKEYESGLPAIDADPVLLRVVFQNILSNAVRYGIQGGSVTITVKKQDEKNALLSVADTGIGIPQQQQQKVFQKFFRADNAREKEPDGSGLGLYVTKAIIDYAEGKIWFSSEEGVGSTFFVTLPLAGMQRRERVE